MKKLKRFVVTKIHRGQNLKGRTNVHIIVCNESKSILKEKILNFIYIGTSLNVIFN